MKIIFLIISLLFFISASGQRVNEGNNKKIALNNKITEGDAFKIKGDLASAETSYKAAIEITEQLLAENSSYRIILFNLSIFDSYDRLGQLYLLANNPQKATEYFLLSRKLRDKHLPRKSVFRIAPLIGLGKVSLSQKNITQASLYFFEAEKLLNASTTSFFNSEPIRKELLFNLFEISLLHKKYKKAEKYLDQLASGGMGAPLTGADAERMTKVFEMRGRYYMHTGNYKKAHEFLDKAGQFSEIFKTSVVDFRILKSKALLKWTENDIPSAANFFYGMINLYKNYISTNFTSMSEPERESFFAVLREDFDLFYSFAMQNQSFADRDELNGMVYNNQLFSKALLLNEINKLKNQILASNDLESKKKLQEWEAKKTRLSSLYYSASKNSSDEISSLEGQINDLERDLNRKSSLLRHIGEEKTWDQVQSTLVAGEGAIEIVRLNKFIIRSKSISLPDFQFSDSVVYMVLLISPESKAPSSFLIQDGNALEGRFLKYYRNCIISKLEDTISYNKYWLPIKKQLAGFKKIYVSADGVYNQINLNTLRNPLSKEYLLDEINVVSVTNTKDLCLKKTRKPGNHASLFGRPVYLLDSLHSNPTATKREGTSTRTIRSETMDNFRTQTFDDLPGTETEIKSIENFLKEKEWNVSTYFGQSASEENLKAQLSPSVLHIATHGFFLKESTGSNTNSMIRSGIILAGANNKHFTQDDGILTAYEATNLVLDSTYLIVLSACETGLGEIENGEGVYGLQRGFAVAGARYLLMSLWKVDDFATNFLMQKFYRSWLDGKEIHESVRLAQQELRAQYPEPYYWGAFVLLGN